LELTPRDGCLTRARRGSCALREYSAIELEPLTRRRWFEPELVGTPADHPIHPSTDQRLDHRAIGDVPRDPLAVTDVEDPKPFGRVAHQPIAKEPPSRIVGTVHGASDPAGLLRGGRRRRLQPSRDRVGSLDAEILDPFCARAGFLPRSLSG